MANTRQLPDPRGAGLVQPVPRARRRAEPRGSSHVTRGPAGASAVMAAGVRDRKRAGNRTVTYSRLPCPHEPGKAPGRRRVAGGGEPADGLLRVGAESPRCWAEHHGISAGDKAARADRRRRSRAGRSGYVGWSPRGEAITTPGTAAGRHFRALGQPPRRARPRPVAPHAAAVPVRLHMPPQHALGVPPQQAIDDVDRLGAELGMVGNHHSPPHAETTESPPCPVNRSTGRDGADRMCDSNDPPGRSQRGWGRWVSVGGSAGPGG